MGRPAGTVPICAAVILATIAGGCLRRPARPPAPSRPASEEASPAPPRTPVPAAAATLFQTALRPVLSRKCAPCHEPGGRMYGRMPFDDPRTITGHLEGIRRRLKGEDRETLERWIASLPPATPPR